MSVTGMLQYPCCNDAVCLIESITGISIRDKMLYTYLGKGHDMQCITMHFNILSFPIKLSIIKSYLFVIFCVCVCAIIVIYFKV